MSLGKCTDCHSWCGNTHSKCRQCLLIAAEHSDLEQGKHFAPCPWLSLMSSTLLLSLLLPSMVLEADSSGFQHGQYQQLPRNSLGLQCHIGTFETSIFMDWALPGPQRPLSETAFVGLQWLHSVSQCNKFFFIYVFIYNKVYVHSFHMLCSSRKPWLEVLMHF